MLGRAPVRDGDPVREAVRRAFADTDEMVETCQANGVIFAGGNLQRARHDVQHAARMLQQGQLGTIQGAAVHGWQGEIVGGGCQHVAVLRLLTGAEVTSVVGWFDPPEGLRDDDGLAVDNTERDGESLQVRGLFGSTWDPLPGLREQPPHPPRELSSDRLDTHGCCRRQGDDATGRGVEVWTDRALVRWDWGKSALLDHASSSLADTLSATTPGPPEVFYGFDDEGARIPVPMDYPSFEYEEFSYLTGSIR